MIINHVGTGREKVSIGVKLNDDGTQDIIINDTGRVVNLTTMTSDATAVDENVLDGCIFYANGLKRVGTMVNNGDMSKVVEGINSTSLEIPAGYTTGGIIKLAGAEELIRKAIERSY